ncbi:type VI secretion system ImpA family N-terminal domain-containing protein [Duganella sp. Root336D2]|uniref:type VI secretion system ImpA family N-terminal domain-containing protein n=1 Tax=Duganella sp. Root336D2 TaxID=1736518 RepID=UPI0007015251|nr:type VI secretion system ImpA family N-terminal domain-containing protein [Duganella sp. Root336D2]KQV45846.1 type VI secretion protein [Duganella sp. Root336D2]
MFTTEDLLVPVSVGQPCGEDVSFDACMDAIAAARRQDDPTLEQGEWAVPLHSADWPLVANRCAELLRLRSKDLRLAVWLAEARAHTHRMRGLGDGFLLLAGLCERFWEQLHPLPDGGGHELRSGSLAWLLARTPALVQGCAADDDAEAGLQDARHCLAGLQRLQAAVDARLGADGPAFGLARDAVRRALEDAERTAPPGRAVEPTAIGGAAAAKACAPRPGAPGQPAMPQTREHALVQLRLVAEFFRRTEPHSPVAYLAEKAANWGELALHEWLRAVVKDPAQVAQLDELLGAAPQA